MKPNAIYFPYINVPREDWFTRVLLYWERVDSIVPSDFIRNPELLDPYMLELVQAGLVHQIIPSQYIGSIPNFASTFVAYVDE